MISGTEIKGGKILGTIEFRENVCDFWHGTDKLLNDFVQGCLVDDEDFPPLPLGAIMIRAEQLEWLLHDFCI